MSGAWMAEKEGYRVVYDKNTSMGFAYRARLIESTSLVLRRPRWHAVIDRHFMGWRPGYAFTRRRKTREAAAADANRWLDAKSSFDGTPPHASSVEGETQ